MIAMYKNLKIQINDQQPLDEVVKTLESKGYRKLNWFGFKNTVIILTYKNNGWFTDYTKDINDSDHKLTTLAELKEM